MNKLIELKIKKALHSIVSIEDRLVRINTKLDLLLQHKQEKKKVIHGSH